MGHECCSRHENLAELRMRCALLGCTKTMHPDVCIYTGRFVLAAPNFQELPMADSTVLTVNLNYTEAAITSMKNQNALND